MRWSLATQISLAIVGVLLLAVLSSLVAIGSAYEFAALQETIVAENLASVRAAEELEIALLDQRGYVSSYVLDDGNPHWLKLLSERESQFDVWLEAARETTRVPQEQRILDKLQIVQDQYAELRHEAVRRFDQGDREEAKRILLHDVADLYSKAYDLCEDFIDMNNELVDQTSAQVRQTVTQVTWIVSITGAMTLLLGFGLLWLFFRGVILPLRKLSVDARRAAGGDAGPTLGNAKDEFGELGRYMQLLMTNVEETRWNLEQSREQLAHAEKLAAVGKLAASVAHEIRNPLTAMKMWLYSLRRTAAWDDPSMEKLNVVAAEMVRLENIVRQFLEFSRPPQLKTAACNVVALIDETLDLQKYLLEQHGIRLQREYEAELPEICADREQLKQVFLNLLNNAIDAMPGGGELQVAVAQRRQGARRMVFVRVADTGVGMPPEVQQRIFEPFFTTKPEGTGLGLCIAAAIVARHGGTLSLASSTPHGTAWDICLPAFNVAEHSGDDSTRRLSAQTV
jgi:signal transduction histidine kinase